MFCYKGEQKNETEVTEACGLKKIYFRWEKYYVCILMKMLCLEEEKTDDVGESKELIKYILKWARRDGI